MARFLKAAAGLLASVLYAVMLALILIFYSGHGAFIYEKF